MQLNIREIEAILPHRYPFLLIDHVDSLDEERIVARKLVSRNEPHFEGHFPGHPVMPGVLIVEAMAQAGAIFAAGSSSSTPTKQVVYFMGMDKVKFRKPVTPGDVLRLEVVPLRKGGAIWKMRGEAKVGDAVVCRGRVPRGHPAPHPASRPRPARRDERAGPAAPGPPHADLVAGGVAADERRGLPLLAPAHHPRRLGRGRARPARRRVAGRHGGRDRGGARRAGRRAPCRSRVDGPGHRGEGTVGGGDADDLFALELPGAATSADATEGPMPPRRPRPAAHHRARAQRGPRRLPSRCASRRGGCCSARSGRPGSASVRPTSASAQGARLLVSVVPVEPSARGRRRDAAARRARLHAPAPARSTRGRRRAGAQRRRHAGRPSWRRPTPRPRSQGCSAGRRIRTGSASRSARSPTRAS